MESKLQRKVYYTEYPESFFYATSDDVALLQTTALVVYRESNTLNGRPFVILRDEYKRRTEKSLEKVKQRY